MFNQHEYPELRTVESVAATEIFHYTEIGNFEASGLVTNEQIATYLRETIPPTHLENCPSIQYEEMPHPFSPNALGLFNRGTHEINIYGPPERFAYENGGIVGVMTHEIGHNVHQNLIFIRPDLAAQWLSLHANSVTTGQGFVSQYAATNGFEDFAESYKYYVVDPVRLQFYSPHKYDFMRQIFSGQEYIPASTGAHGYGFTQ